jgi:hypothetical protein
MIFRNLDASGDWTFGQGKGNYVAGNTAIGLNIKTRVLSWVNDCFFDKEAGIDWLNRLGLKNQFDLLKADLARVISQSEGVTGLNTLTVSLVGRSFSAQYSVDTIYSLGYQGELNQEI